MIAPDFPLEFAGFFLREKSRKTREISGTSREKSGKYSLGIQLLNGILAYSYARFYVGTRTSPTPGPAPAPIPARPAIPARHPGPPLPARSSPAVRHLQPNFSLNTVFFPEHTGSREKFGTKGENSLAALKRPCTSRRAAPRRAAQNVVPRHLVELSACTQCCISHGNCLKS